MTEVGKCNHAKSLSYRATMMKDGKMKSALWPIPAENQAKSEISAAWLIHPCNLRVFISDRFSYVLGFWQYAGFYPES